MTRGPFASFLARPAPPPESWPSRQRGTGPPGNTVTSGSRASEDTAYELPTPSAGTPALPHVPLGQACGWDRLPGGRHIDFIGKETEAQREVTDPWMRRDRVRIQSRVPPKSPWSRLVLGRLPLLPTEPGSPGGAWSGGQRGGGPETPGPGAVDVRPAAARLRSPKVSAGAVAWADACGDRRTPVWW